MDAKWSVAVLPLVTRVAIESAGTRSGRSTDGSTFKAAAGLVANDAAKCCSTQPADHRTLLGIRANRCRAVGKKKGDDRQCQDS